MMICPSSKRAWRNKRIAKRHLKKTQSAGDIAVKSVYKCPHCGYWHMTKRVS